MILTDCMRLLLLPLALLLLPGALCGTETKACPKKPNIILILTDDAGWADFQVHDRQMKTPHIAKLRKSGLLLTQSYVLPMCAPTRSALLTGRYPHTFGAQNGKAAGTDRVFWVNETLKFMPQELQEMGYTTHMVGKWHLGFCHPSLTPLGRGFNTTYGFLLGAHPSYFYHTKKGYDWWDNYKLDLKADGKYSTDLLNKRAVKLIKKAEPNQPFFMYLAHMAPHGPLNATAKYLKKCKAVKDADRRTHCAMVAAVDNGVGKIVRALKKKNIYDQTVILFMSDNGGPITQSSFNYPLRGGKKTIYEGGTRSFTVLKAPCMKKSQGEKYTGMVHAIDWLPTFVSMAGGKPKKYMHGVSVWDSIRNFEASPRTEFLYTRDDYYKFNHSAFRYNNWKLIQGDPGFDEGWYLPPGMAIKGDLKPQNIMRQLDYKHFEFYDIDADPSETNDLYGKPEYADIIQEVLDRRDALMDEYPLQPFKESARDDNWVYKQDKKYFINTCWCWPPGVQATESCPLPDNNGKKG